MNFEGLARVAGLLADNRELKAMWPAWVEGSLFDSCRQPIFAKIHSHSTRTFWLWEGFELEPDYLKLAGGKIAAHHQAYGFTEHFPIEHYVLFLSDRSVRFSNDGEVLGEFDDEPANPRFIVAGESYTVV